VLDFEVEAEARIERYWYRLLARRWTSGVVQVLFDFQVCRRYGSLLAVSERFFSTYTAFGINSYWRSLTERIQAESRRDLADNKC